MSIFSDLNPVNELKSALNDVSATMTRSFESAFSDAIYPVESAVSSAGDRVANSIAPALSSIPSDVASKLSPYFNELQGTLNNISSSLNSIPITISNGFKNIGGYITSGMSSGASIIGSDISKAISPLTEVFTNMFNYLKGAFNNTVSALQSLGSDLGKIRLTISNFVSSAKSFMLNFFSNISKALGNFFNKYVGHPLADFYNGTIIPAVNYIKNNIVNPFLKDLDVIKIDFINIASTLGSVGKDIVIGAEDIGNYTVNAYKFLVAKPFVLPNWAWLTIGIVGGGIGIAVGSDYAKGYFEKAGMVQATKIHI